jgi:hypothetical protein
MRITDFFKKFDVLSLTDFINEYRDAGCGIETEALFDLRNYDDYYLFANVYGLKKARECQKENRFWWGGTAYDEPMLMKDEVGAFLDYIDNCVDEDIIFNYPTIFEKYMRVEDYKESLA